MKKGIAEKDLFVKCYNCGKPIKKGKVNILCEKCIKRFEAKDDE